MNVAVFDLDGTLTRTNAEDDDAFIGTMADVLGIVDLDPDWSRYVNQTDQGLMEEVIAKARGRGPLEEEAATFRAAFLDRIARVFSGERPADLAMPGASALLHALQESGWRVAIATGCWAPSARRKLTAAGLPGDLPLATSDDAVARIDILRIAIARAADSASSTARVVYVGDRPWDGGAAAALGVGFVGVAGATPPELLRAAGATAILEDLSPAVALPALERAARPYSSFGSV